MNLKISTAWHRRSTLLRIVSRKGSFAAGVVLLMLQTGPAAAVVDWLQPGLNAQHTGFNAKENILSAGNVKHLSESWDKPAQQEITAQPILAGNRVFVLSTDGTLYARNATSGKLLWSFVADKNGAPSYWGAASDGKTIYVNCQLDYDDTEYLGHGGLCALDVKSGKQLWSFAIYQEGSTSVDSSPYSPPVIDGKNVIFGESDSASFAHVGYVITLNAKTGKQITGVGNCADTLANFCNYVSSAPAAVDGGTLFYQGGAQNGPQGSQGAVCRRAETASTVDWCYYNVDVNLALTVANGLVLFVEGTSSSTSNLIALDETSGAVVWSTEVNSGQNNTHFAPAVADGLAYFSVGLGQNSLYAVSLKTGKIAWTYANGRAGFLTSGVTVANGVVYAICSANSGAQCAFDAKSGKVLRSDVPGGSAPATPIVVNGAEITVCNYNDLCRFAP
jgi:eukaryotic-like serine/threonine-protein kinase